MEGNIGTVPEEIEDNGGGRWGLPREFDLKAEIRNYKFWLMTKVRLPHVEIFQKRHDAYLKELTEYVQKHTGSTSQTTKIVNRVVSNAYNTIPEEFWNRTLKTQGFNSLGEKDKVQAPYVAPKSSKKKKK